MTSINPQQKRRWVDQGINVLMTLYYLGLAGVGVIGLRDPSVSIVGAIGNGYVFYSFGLIATSVMALVSVALQNRRAQAICLVMFGLLTMLHGAMLILAGTNGYQSGARLIIAMPILLVTAYYLSQTTQTRHDIDAELFQQEQDAEDGT